MGAVGSAGCALYRDIGKGACKTMKRLFAVAMLSLLMVFAASCGGRTAGPADTAPDGPPAAEDEGGGEKEPSSPGAAPAGENDSEAEREELPGSPPASEGAGQAAGSLFAQLPGEFDFSSGAGGWFTHMDLETDGTFSGTFMDSDMGDTGEQYPDGTVYICSFSGKFSEPEPVGDNVYALSLESLTTEGTPQEAYCKEGIRYVPAGPYGLEGGTEFLLYTPGIDISELPEGFVFWLWGFFDPCAAETLPCYGIYNPEGDAGFVGGYQSQ